MKVFISHSSADRWIAEKISEDIRRLGVETFLDANDIETGDDFDEKIRQQLISSDEMLVIISPLALKSQWVMMEFGAARTLGKRLIIVLVGVSPNELPSPVNRHLARDLNQVESYYDELLARQRLGNSGDSGSGSAGADLLMPPPRPQREDGTLRVGDRVVITERPLDPESFPVLVEAMEQYLGLEGRIIAVESLVQDRAFRLDVDGGTFFWAERWLRALG